MVKTIDIMRLLRKSFLEQKSGMYALSHPVIRKEDGTYHFAMFLGVKNEEDEAKGVTKRPVMYCLSDVDVPSKNAKMYQCQKHDFCSEPFDKIYRNTLPSGMEVTEEIAAKTYEALDEAREMLIAKGPTKAAKEKYDIYMSRLMAIVPPEMAVFYKSLSDFPVEESEEGKTDEPQEEKKEPEKKQEEVKNLSQTADVSTELLRPEQRREFIQQKAREEVPAEEPKEGEKQEPEEEMPTEKQILEGIRWTPTENLSMLQERYYQIFSRISERIQFLPCEEEGLVRFKYPLYCFRKDMTEGVERWLDLQNKLLGDDMRFGHMKLRTEGPLFMRCRNKDKCIFRSCPHIVAAYIQYLKLIAPDELKRQRDMYRRNKQQVDRMDESEMPFILNPVKTLDPAKLKAGFASAESGWIGIEKDGNTGEYKLSWQKMNKNRRNGLRSVKISEDMLTAGEFDPAALRDTEGRQLSEKVGYAILADNLNKRGILRKIISELQQQDVKPKQEPQKPAQQKAPVREEAPVQQEARVPEPVPQWTQVRQTVFTAPAGKSGNMTAIFAEGKLSIGIDCTCMDENAARKILEKIAKCLE